MSTLNKSGASVTPVTVTTIDTNIAARVDDLREIYRTQRRIRELRQLLTTFGALVNKKDTENEIIKLASKNKAIKERLLAFINQ